MQNLKRLVTFTLFILLLACGAKPLPELAYTDTILAFGDSLTAGVGAKETQAYPAILQNLSNRTVINAGISGETTTEGLQRFAQTINQYSPQLIILLEGGNDILRNHNQAKTKSNLEEMILIAKNQAIPVVLIGVPEKSLFSDAAPLYAELADKYQLVYEGELLAGLLKSPRLKSDPIHLNAQGYKKMAEEIHALLKRNGVL